MKVLGVVSVKGGVGKTTVVSNLGVILKRNYGLSCVLVDGNISVPNLGLHMDITDSKTTLQEALEKGSSLADAVSVHSSGIHIIVGSMSKAQIAPGSLETRIGDLAAKYDLVLIDSSPGMGYEPLEVMKCSDALVVITCLDFPSVSAALKSLRMAHELGKPVLGVVLNRVRGSGDELDIGAVKEILSTKVIARIPEDPKVHEAIARRIPVVLFSPQSPASAAYAKLAQELAEAAGLKKQM